VDLRLRSGQPYLALLLSLFEGAMKKKGKKKAKKRAPFVPTESPNQNLLKAAFS